jgi:hypothetical protein
MRQPIYLIEKDTLPDDFLTFLEQVEEEKQNHPDNNWSVHSDFVLQYVVSAWNNNVTSVTEIVQGIIQAIKNSDYENWIRNNYSC